MLLFELIDPIFSEGIFSAGLNVPDNEPWLSKGFNFSDWKFFSSISIGSLGTTGE